MNRQPSKPILYLITRGASSEATTADCPEFKQILEQVSAAIAAGIDLIQIREKRLTARVLFELATRAAALTRGSSSRLLINDRADVAAAAGADGVHLTSQSIDARIVRDVFGEKFLIGVSTHSLAEASEAKAAASDFVVFGPVFETASKREYGAPAGVERLAEVARALADFPVLALGGINLTNAATCLQAGASGIASIGIFSRPDELSKVVFEIRQKETASR
jgi:thiamine-phosphate pyrophosphorylase